MNIEGTGKGERFCAKESKHVVEDQKNVRDIQARYEYQHQLAVPKAGGREEGSFGKT